VLISPPLDRERLCTPCMEWFVILDETRNLAVKGLTPGALRVGSPRGPFC